MLRLLGTFLYILNLSKMDQQTQEMAQIKKYVQSYGKPDNKKAIAALSLTIAFEILAIVLININLRFIGWTLHTLNTIRIFVQFHDMAHFSFFSSMKANTIIGKIIGIYEHFPFNAWRDGHNHHHKHFGNIDRLDVSQTILFTLKQYEQMKGVKKILARILRSPPVFFLITVPFVWFVLVFPTVAKRYGIFSMTYLEKILSVVLYTWIFPLFGVSALNMWLSMTVSTVIGTGLFHLQHSVNLPYRKRKDKWNPAKAALEGSTFLEIPNILKPFTNGIEYHHIHHLNTNVPSYAIQQCHDDFQDKNKHGKKWDSYNINRVGFRLGFESLFNIMFDEQNSKLIPFKWKFI